MKQIIFTFLLTYLIIGLVGCSSKFPSMLSESWSENYALAANGAQASMPEINDGDMETIASTKPPDRSYTIIFPEEKKISRVVIYNQNILSYQILYWDKKVGEWKLGYLMDYASGKKQVYSDLNKLEIPQLDNRVNFTTDKIKLLVTKANSDGFAITRTPSKDDKIINHKIEYIGSGRDRMRVDIYQIYVYGYARIREIEAYGHKY